MGWLKAAGIVLVIAGSGLWGLMGARRLAQRVEELKNLRLALNFLEKEITYMHTPLSSAFKKTAYFCAPPLSCFFLACSERLDKKAGVTAAEAWMTGLKELQKISSLKPEDIELLKTVAMQIGMSDTYEQHKFLALLQEELKIIEQKAREEAQTGGKLWSYGGFILGALLVLLFI
ncbi:stage III sporulation protein AB [Thermosyntropha lipolytica DSM 11003]|uniref:Stage III sporulation protein AB n=1 Tax=Thermosyntropha lipolytica DSM 11003 TaxID=1123382 RepID=A0A1M5LJK6_9FIRM|nr:hypothetical protein [Thermosyntropha lipolytica]SHG65334.1 stage III sporulation protein AB [Thermosyntropha lipolytica DSM 11003]